MPAAFSLSMISGSEAPPVPWRRPNQSIMTLASKFSPLALARATRRASASTISLPVSSLCQMKVSM
ncbi:hypothetical protein D3C78_1741930 [compost metagenome]